MIALRGVRLQIRQQACGRGVAEGKVECKPRGGENADVAMPEAGATAIAWVRAQIAQRRAAADAC